MVPSWNMNLYWGFCFLSFWNVFELMVPSSQQSHSRGWELFVKAQFPSVSTSSQLSNAPTSGGSCLSDDASALQFADSAASSSLTQIRAQQPCPRFVVWRRFCCSFQSNWIHASHFTGCLPDRRYWKHCWSFSSSSREPLLWMAFRLQN